MKNKKIWILVGILLLVALAAALFFMQKRTGPVTNFTPEFEAEQQQDPEEAQINEPQVGRGIRIPGYSEIHVAANATEVSVDLYNPEENQVYFQIAFVLTDTEEKIYESKLVEPGQHLYKIQLLRTLAPGEYPLTIQYSTFSTDGSFTPKNGATLNCVLVAE